MTDTPKALVGLMDRAAAPFGPISDLETAYRILRLVVGFLAVTLCPAVVLADHAFGDPDGLRGSVSAYYYGRGGNWFVGALFAIAIFFLSYESQPRDGGRDSRPVDNLLSSFASLCAIIVALVPTSSSGSAARGSELVAHRMHGVAAALLFCSLAGFSLFQFTKTSELVTPTPQKVRRNMVYRACGWLIVASLLVALATIFFELGSLFFWAEVVAVSAFGVSWLVKGEAVGPLNDPDPVVISPTDRSLGVNVR